MTRRPDTANHVLEGGRLAHRGGGTPPLHGGAS